MISESLEQASATPCSRSGGGSAHSGPSASSGPMFRSTTNLQDRNKMFHSVKAPVNADVMPRRGDPNAMSMANGVIRQRSVGQIGGNTDMYQKSAGYELVNPGTPCKS